MPCIAGTTRVRPNNALHPTPPARPPVHCRKAGLAGVAGELGRWAARQGMVRRIKPLSQSGLSL